jgi:serine protease Do
VTRGRIGVQIGEVSKDVAQAIGLSKTEGALVSGVQADTPAEKGGVLPGDVILKFNNKPIVKWSDLPRIVGETKPGTKAALEVWRKGKAITLNVTVAPMKGPEAVAKETEAEEKAPTKLTQALGLGVVSVPAEMQKKLRIKGGVLVKEVAESAVSSGIAEDDIVLAINDADITSAEQFVQVVTALDKTRPVGLMVRRGEQTQWLVIKPAKVDDKD